MRRLSHIIKILENSMFWCLLSLLKAYVYTVDLSTLRRKDDGILNKIYQILNIYSDTCLHDSLKQVPYAEHVKNPSIIGITLVTELTFVTGADTL